MSKIKLVTLDIDDTLLDDNLGSKHESNSSGN